MVMCMEDKVVVKKNDTDDRGGEAGAPRGPYLRIDRNLAVRFGAEGDLQFKTPRGWQSTGRFGPLILELFAHQMEYVKAFQILSQRATGQAELQEMLVLVKILEREGVLQSDRALDDGGREHRFFASSTHIEMLNDVDRTGRFLDAIGAVVRPGDVVLDLGAGTGVLTLASARAGARKVYAVEVSGDVRLIRELCREYIENGVVQPIQEWSTSVDLPEQADVLAAEIIGVDPFGEDILELTMDARRRLLTRDARLVPRGLKVLGLPVTIPEDQLDRYRFTENTVEKWAGLWGEEFRRLSRIDCERWDRFHLKAQETRDWDALARPAVLTDIDLATVESSEFEATVTTEATACGRLNGVVVFFEADLDGGVALSTHPALASPNNHWPSPVWCVNDGRDVDPGDTISIRYSRKCGKTSLSCEF
jgi:hypothetical protein